jgi:hypothetical protein
MGESLHAESALNDSEVPKEARRQFAAFQRLSAYAFASLIVVVLILVF